MGGPRKIRGRFCEVSIKPKTAFAAGSMRWKKSGAAWVLVACKKGKFKNARCTTGMQAVKILKPQAAGRCRTGRPVRKG